MNTPSNELYTALLSVRKLELSTLWFRFNVYLIINSGLMIAHVTAAALASENKFLCHPASIDSIPTSTDKEDHVSMGGFATRKCCQLVENMANILAI